MIKVKGYFQYREGLVYTWFHLNQRPEILAIALGPKKYSISDWSAIRREFDEIRWEELPSPIFDTQREIRN